MESQNPSILRVQLSESLPNESTNKYGGYRELKQVDDHC
jgi:hypothetical protein